MEFSKNILIFAQQLKLKFNTMGIITEFKKIAALRREYEDEIARLEEDHKKVVAQILKDHRLEIISANKENVSALDMYRRDINNLKEKLKESEDKLKAQLSERDRMEKLLTKINKRAGTYRAMMKAVAAWEEEISFEREEDKMEEFIKWRNLL